MTRVLSSLLFVATLATLATAAVVATAQQEGCANTVLVASESDLSSVADCSSFSGTLTISGPAINTVTLPALTSLSGTIKVMSNPHLTTLTLDNLTAVSGSIFVSNNTILSVVSLPVLQTLTNLEIITAPGLRQLSLNSIASLGSLKIEDTGLDNSGQLPWSGLQSVADLGVSNNKYLKSIDMNHLKTVSGMLVVAANGLIDGKSSAEGGTTLSLNNLMTVSNCTFRHLTDLKLPVLSSVSASLSIDETNLKTIQVPLLKTVGQTLSIVSNNKLSNVTFSELTSVGGALLIANNTELTVVDGFKQLKEIAGVLNMRGAFSTVSLPSVSSVQGGMSILSSSNTFDCSSLSKVKDSARGKTICQAHVKSAMPTNADGTSVLESSGSSLLVTEHLAQGSMGSVLAALSYLLFLL
ncbi:hypothetical protein BGZ83_010570 [Gryganskiella cystojenkinii]|nr:hypothetical protein BGZ83_010570 [Gryganskiella cystojenkinii]